MHEWANEKRFLERVNGHTMEVIRDDGVYRHVRFSKEGTSDDRFDLVTWPWHLCYTGDMGTYVFSRIEDMFSFFRTRTRDDGSIYINDGYWAEKALAVDKHSGLHEFSEQLFRDVVREIFDDLVDEHELDKEGSAELWEAIDDDVLSCIENGEVVARAAAAEFSCEVQGQHFEFADFWEHNFQVYTGRFLWACYAIAWGIEQYETAKSEPEGGDRG